MDEVVKRFTQIFFPHTYEEQQRVQTQGIRLVHYTSAEAATSILQNEEFWIRESSCMNDYMETVHGLDCVKEAYKTDDGLKLRNILNELFPDITSKIEDLFNGWQFYLETDTYLGCFSEHDPSEDTLGRLSMWRAYSESKGIALVFKNDPFFNESDVFNGLYASPVAYFDGQGVASKMALIAQNMKDNEEFLKAHDEEYIVNAVFQALKFASLCTKHPGFKEEKEWRIVYCPMMEQSPIMKKAVQIIKGIPQTVYKVPIKDMPDLDVKNGVSLPRILDRIIIGPTEFPLAIKKAFINILESKGIDNPEQKVFISAIPLR